MSEDKTIVFPEYCDLLSFEKVLDEHLNITSGIHHYLFDFGQVRWIGILQMSMIYGWIASLRHDEKRISIHLPRRGSNAERFIASTAFIRELINLGCEVPNPQPIEGGFGLAAFKSFDTREAYLAYETNLADPHQMKPLLSVASDAPQIHEGSFRTILLHELCDNAFLHGAGENVRYGVAVYPASELRNPHKILSSFNGAAFLEVVVSDSGSGIVCKELYKQITSSYHPDYILPNRPLPKDIITALFAFEFSSTKEPEARKQRIAKILETAKNFSDAIATGLWFVSSLVRHYGGQILVRTGTILLSLDFSVESSGKVSSKTGLRKFSGTHVLIRIPRTSGIAKPTSNVIKTSPRQHSLTELVPVLLEDASVSSIDPPAFVVNAERIIDEAKSVALKSKTPVVAVLCDGLDADHKAFSVLLTQLAIAPRRNRTLLLLGVQSELLLSAKRQWEGIKQLRLNPQSTVLQGHGFQSFLLVGIDAKEIVVFGDTGLPESTKLIYGASPNSHLELAQEEIADIYFKALCEKLKTVISLPPICHPPDYFYLIENKYYTSEFYEIGLLVTSHVAQRLVISYFREFLKRNSVGAVYSIAEPLSELIDEMEGLGLEVHWAKRNEDMGLRHFLEALRRKGKDKKLLLITDVICTGESVTKYLSKIAAPELGEIIVTCFVDARDKPVNYITIERDDPIKVNVLSLSRRKIKALDNLPPGTDMSKVLVVDRKTHTPKAWDSISKPTILLPEDLVEHAYSCGAMLSGHVEFESKHYTHFLVQSCLIQSLRSNLETWWDSMLSKLSSPDEKGRALTVLYLDEGRGWETTLIPDFFSTKAGVQTKRLTLEIIDAPYPKNYVTEQVNEVWLILGAMAHGKTAARALKYITGFYRTRQISICVVVARMDTTWLSFWQNITSFSGTNVHLDFFSYLPLQPYDSISSCPICNLNIRIDHALNLTQSYGALTSLLESRARMFDVNKLTSPESHSFDLAIQDPKQKILATLRCLFQDGIDNRSRRKVLEARLKNHPADLETLVEVFAEDVFMLNPATSDRLSKVRDVLYQSYDNLEETVHSLMKLNGTKLPSLQGLFGALALYPAIIESSLPSLFREAVLKGNRKLAEDIVFVALIEPTVRSRFALEVMNMKAEFEWASTLLREIKTYPHWAGDNRAVEAFVELIWFLTRSTAWNDTINALGILMLLDDRQMEQARAFHMFESTGIKRVFAQVERLKINDATDIVGSLWSAIKVESPDIDATLERLHQAIDHLRALMSESHNQVQGQQRLDALLAVNDQGSLLLKQLKLIYRTPVDAKREVAQHLNAHPLNKSYTLQWQIDPGQAGILIGLEDLKQSLLAVLENADNCLQKIPPNLMKDYWVKIAFHGPDQGFSIMTICDNLPWKKGIDATGGLKQFAEHCRKYAALHEFNPKCEDEHLRIRVTYRTLPIRE